MGQNVDGGGSNHGHGAGRANVDGVVQSTETVWALLLRTCMHNTTAAPGMRKIMSVNLRSHCLEVTLIGFMSFKRPSPYMHRAKTGRSTGRYMDSFSWHLAWVLSVHFRTCTCIVLRLDATVSPGNYIASLKIEDWRYMYKVQSTNPIVLSSIIYA